MVNVYNARRPFGFLGGRCRNEHFLLLTSTFHKIYIEFFFKFKWNFTVDFVILLSKANSVVYLRKANILNTKKGSHGKH